MLGDAMGSIVEPMLLRYLQGIPDEALPKMAHGIVDNAIQQGGLSLMDGNVIFDLEDLRELKKLLEWNLPLASEEVYNVITKEEVV